MPDLPTLPLPLISWIFTIAGIAALLFGAGLLTLMYKAGKLPESNMDYTVWNDIILLGIWGMSFMAGLGMLNYKPWAPKLLEFFCWVMIALMFINSATRIMIMKQKFRRDPTAGEFKWTPVLAGSAMGVVPIVAFCALTIYTLYDPATKEEYRASAMAAAERN